jgi:hypothetical protein
MRMKKSAITIALVCGIAVAPVRDAESAPSLGLRAGFEPVTGTGSLTRTFPIWLEGRYTVSGFSFGAYFQYAPAGVGRFPLAPCGTATSCSGRVTRLGAEILYDILPEARIVPWVGVGAGLGWTRVSSSDFPVVQGNTTIIVSGVTTTEGQFNFTLQAGGHVRVSGRFAIGPYIAVTQATTQSGTSFQFGLRSTFDL